MSLAISTSWNAHRSQNAAELLFEIKALGFSAVELSFNLEAEFVEALGRESSSQGIRISSVHNYCPIPPGLTRREALPDCYSLASLEEEERRLAVKYTKHTISTASGLGARAVVLHCGRVQIPDATRRLIELYDQGRSGQPGFIKVKEKMLRQRNARSAAFLDQAVKSLDELNTYAQTKNIFLGVETRFYHCEIPALSEIGIILDKFSHSQIYYWHDTGHAQLMENLGLAKHKDFLDLYGHRLLGVHLHNIRGCRDHLSPGSGTMDFGLLKPYLKKDTLLTIEAHSPATAEDISRGRDLIRKIYGTD